MGGYNFARELRNGVRADDKKHVITLNEYEMALIELVTRDKLRVEEMRGIVHRVSDFEKRRDGFAAELAFCKLFNVYRDFGMQYTGYDVVIGDERKTVDIKQTNYNDGKLIVDVDANPCDLYALMVGQGRTFCFRGGISGRLLFSALNIETLNGKRYYAAAQSRLSMTLTF